MCSNYEPVTREDRLLAFFGVAPDREHPGGVIFPSGLAPFIRLAEDGSGNRRVDTGGFGMPAWRPQEMAYGKPLHNARSETVHRLPSFRDAWRRGQRCIIPAESIFEPEYDAEGTKSVRTRIYRPGDVPMGIAGIYGRERDPETGEEKFTFSMLTVNAEGHPVFQRFHKPGDEKRMVVILDPEQYDEWLSCQVAQAPKFFKQWMGPLETYDAPLPPRAPRTHSGKVVVPPKPVEDPGLF